MAGVVVGGVPTASAVPPEEDVHVDYSNVSQLQRLRGTVCTVHPDHLLALVGEAPGPRTRCDLPFYPYPPTSAAGRLRAILGWSRSEYLLTFARRNLIQDYPGPHFPIATARLCVPGLVASLHPRPMLLMGRGVATAFGVAELPPLTLATRVVAGWTCTLAVVPHTSGRNLWYNDPRNREAVRDFICNLAGDLRRDREAIRRTDQRGHPEPAAAAATQPILAV